MHTLMTNHPNRSKRSPNPWRSPPPPAVVARRHAAGLTQSGAANLICGSTRGWQGYEDGSRSMHPGFWKLFWLLTAPLVEANGQPAPLEPNPAIYSTPAEPDPAPPNPDA